MLARGKYPKFYKVFDGIVLSPLFATINTALAVLAGCFFGVYAEEIKNAWPLQLSARGPISGPAFFSWTLALWAICGFFVRQRADDAKREAAQKQLVDQAASLEDLIRTLPPTKFLDAFASLHEVADESVSAILANPPFDKDQVETVARIVLGAIATLAKVFDGDREGVRYAANVMLFKRTDEMSETERTSVAERLRFCEDGVSLDGLEGVLDLELPLSAHTGEEKTADGHLKPLALPLPKTQESGGRSKLLPGAPLAFAKGKPDIHTDFAFLRKWCDDKGDFTETVKRNLDAYFKNEDHHLRSFISVPLTSSEGRRLGVLNIHCDRPGMLHDHKQAVGQFVTLIRAEQLLLIKMIIARLEESQTQLMA